MLQWPNYQYSLHNPQVELQGSSANSYDLFLYFRNWVSCEELEHHKNIAELI
jgi:hypothetical protein